MDVTDATFYNAVLMRSHDEPVVVDFWADWCGPCKSLAPVLQEAARERGVTLAKLDVDANHRFALDYQIRGIPAAKGLRIVHLVAEFVLAQLPARLAALL